MNRSKQQGSQAVEFGLVLPFMILVIYAVLDFGFMAYNKAVITNASREAARRGVILSAAAWSTTDVAQVACTYARTALITVGGTGTSASDCSGDRDPDITVTPAAAPAFNTPITVTVSYQMQGFSLAGWLASAAALGAPVTLTATTEMNHE